MDPICSSFADTKLHGDGVGAHYSTLKLLDQQYNQNDFKVCSNPGIQFGDTFNANRLYDMVMHKPRGDSNLGHFMDTT